MGGWYGALGSLGFADLFSLPFDEGGPSVVSSKRHLACLESSAMSSSSLQGPSCNTRRRRRRDIKHVHILVQLTAATYAFIIIFSHYNICSMFQNGLAMYNTC